MIEARFEGGEWDGRTVLIGKGIVPGYFTCAVNRQAYLLGRDMVFRPVPFEPFPDHSPSVMVQSVNRIEALLTPESK